ncbi:hypothetical protein BDW71DRAFT_188965 [Aspergillus fruticulosus]
MKLPAITLPLLGLFASTALGVRIDTTSAAGQVSTVIVPFNTCGNFPAPAVIAHATATPELDGSKYFLCIFFSEPNCRGWNVGSAAEGSRSYADIKWERPALSAHCLQ